MSSLLTERELVVSVVAGRHGAALEEDGVGLWSQWWQKFKTYSTALRLGEKAGELLDELLGVRAGWEFGGRGAVGTVCEGHGGDEVECRMSNGERRVI
jgi:hypothetical protein